MASSIVVTAIEAKLAAEWSACPVIGENAESETPADGSPFLYVHSPFVTREQISFGAPGANTFRETGAVRFVLNIERGAGLDQGRQWADDLVAIFVGQDLNGIIIRAIDGPATDDRNEDGMFYRLAVAVAYERDFIA